MIASFSIIYCRCLIPNFLYFTAGPGQVILGKKIRTSTSTADSVEIGHISREERKSGQGSLVHNLSHNVDSAGMTVSSVGGMEHAKLVKKGDFPMPKGEDKTYLNVFTGDTRIRNMATVVQQGSSGHTTGDVFLDKTKLDQYNVVLQTVPGTNGDTLGSDVHGYFEANKKTLSYSNSTCNIESGSMSKLPENPNAQKNGGRKNIDGRDSGSVATPVGDIKSRLPENTNVRNIIAKLEIEGNQVGIVETPDSSDALNVHDLANEKVLKTGAVSRGFVLKDGNSKAQGKAAYSIAENYKIEAGATDVGAVGSQRAIDLANAIADRYGSGNVRSPKDYGDTTDGGRLGGST
ncbi:unnamed protein product, partial [Allacma fusca]